MRCFDCKNFELMNPNFAKTITKTSLAKGVTKVIPVIGGLVSGGITFASLKPMAARLQEALDKAHFSYSDI